MGDIEPPEGAIVRFFNVFCDESASEETIERRVALLRFLKGGDQWDSAAAWAESLGLKQTNFGLVISLAEQYPRLHRELGQSETYVTATDQFSFERHFQAINHESSHGVWWDESGTCMNKGRVRPFNFSLEWLSFCR